MASEPARGPFVVGLDRQTYNPERTREQSVTAIMASMRGDIVK